MAALCLAAALSIRSLPASSATYGELRPLLAQHCLACHSGESAPLGLRLNSYDGILKGSSKGAVVESGNAADSELIRRIKGSSQPRMPMTGPPFFSASEIMLFERWVANGLEPGKSDTATIQSQDAVQRPAPGEAVTFQQSRGSFRS